MKARPPRSVAKPEALAPELRKRRSILHFDTSDHYSKLQAHCFGLMNDRI